MNARFATKIAGVALATIITCSTSLFGRNFTWIETHAPTNVNFYSIASSADGTKLVAVGNETWFSTNSGMNWTQSMSPGGSYAVASSADGTKMVSVSYPGGIYTSTNFGASWTNTFAPTMNWGAIASSADGTKLVAVTDGGYITDTNGGIYTSTDSGNSWTKQTAAPMYGQGITAIVPNWQGIASSADGTKLAAASYNGDGFGGNGVGICTSINSGATWAYSSAFIISWCSIASSSNGTTLVASCDNGLYASTNSGTSWTQTNLPTIIAQLGIGGPAVALSSDGTKLVAVTDGGGIYASTNSGTTWRQQTNAPNTGWYSIASSADGTKLAAVALDGGIYTGTLLVAPFITASTMLASGQFQFSFDTATGVNYAVQCSTNLTQWLPLVTLEGVGTPLTVTDTNATGCQQRFYRIVATPQ